MKELIIQYDKVIGIPIKECFMCGKPGTRHHVIPKALKPKMNLTIPLCNEHKDITHVLVKQLYFPKELRNKIGRAKKHAKDTLDIMESLREDLRFHKNPHSIKFHGVNSGNPLPAVEDKL